LIRNTVASFLCVAIAATAATTLPAGRPAPNFEVHLTQPNGVVTPAQYKGKVVLLALILTTCPHCQNSTVMLSRLQKEYEGRGLQVMAAAFNEMSSMLVPDFIKTYKPTFPVGYSDRDSVLKFLGRSPNDEMYVPIMVFIDRKGVIRWQHLGDDEFFQHQEQNVRSHIEALLGPAPGAKKGPAVSKTESPKVVVTIDPPAKK